MFQTQEQKDVLDKRTEEQKNIFCFYFDMCSFVLLSQTSFCSSV